MNNFEAPLVNERLEKVIREVEALDIGLNLRQHPEICARLSGIGHHFEDSLHMARIIRAVYDKLQPSLGLEDAGPERLMRAAVLHDIGKSGPAGEEGDMHRAVRQLFVTPKKYYPPYDEHGRARTIAEFVASQDLPDQGADILKSLESSKIDPTNMPIIDFWRRHVAWTYQILEPVAQPDTDIDDVILLATASHHTYEHQDPASLHPEEVEELPLALKMAAALEFIDKYQAHRGRGDQVHDFTHEGAITWLEGLLAKRADLPPALKDSYRAVIEVLRATPEASLS